VLSDIFISDFPGLHLLLSSRSRKSLTSFEYTFCALFLVWTLTDSNLLLSKDPRVFLAIPVWLLNHFLPRYFLTIFPDTMLLSVKICPFLFPFISWWAVLTSSMTALPRIKCFRTFWLCSLVSFASFISLVALLLGESDCTLFLILSGRFWGVLVLLVSWCLSFLSLLIFLWAVERARLILTRDAFFFRRWKLIRTWRELFKLDDTLS
jgi:hypothetical protein